VAGRDAIIELREKPKITTAIIILVCRIEGEVIFMA